MKLVLALVALAVLGASALRLPPAKIESRRAAVGVLLPLFVAPQLASAKYRPSLAESKGLGNSPIVDAAREGSANTDLSFAQLVANSKKMQENMLGRPLTDDELATLEAKIRKFYPNAQ